MILRLRVRRHIRKLQDSTMKIQHQIGPALANNPSTKLGSSISRTGDPITPTIFGKLSLSDSLAEQQRIAAAYREARRCTKANIVGTYVFLRGRTELPEPAARLIVWFIGREWNREYLPQLSNGALDLLHVSDSSGTDSDESVSGMWRLLGSTYFTGPECEKKYLPRGSKKAMPWKDSFSEMFRWLSSSKYWTSRHWCSEYDHWQKSEDTLDLMHVSDSSGTDSSDDLVHDRWQRVF
eukprot:gnl/MRDRNA2_/MRDRNA2_86668_c0_seq3.p1 gnl/MRDRNA2_/MRDRNA2_86668_c0~~gnl/MRDRNA2_/MRDRNA2_86668_c0_seq3.p1  ORF type:complete len:245 (-),score=29.09 gnl/MRDRNA2_/MRDRNA2_86668_c0_seq3:166-876(-)